MVALTMSERTLVQSAEEKRQYTGVVSHGVSGFV
jgi:hypothetical protein